MKVLTPGHKYVAANFENAEAGQTIQFIEKQPDPADCTGHALVTVNDGTTNEELLSVLIDRLAYLNDKFPCMENLEAQVNLQQALFWLNHRTAKRLARNVEGKAVA